MVRFLDTMKCGIALALLMALSFGLTGCVSLQPAPVSAIEAASGAITVPYRISSSGRFLIDVSINDGPAQPLSIDTGATISVIYSDFAEDSDLDVSGRTRFVRGMIGQGDRPVIEDVAFKIGSTTFPLDQVVMLSSPTIRDEAIGLLGGDVLRGYTVLFNKSASTVTFALRSQMDPVAFKGWNHIPLRTLSDAQANTELYFAHTDYDRISVPVLFDTGSNLNLMNWPLAKMDKSIRELERSMIRDGTLQGALEQTPATIETVFYDLRLGRHDWDEVPVVVTRLDGLAAIAPTDEPMMVVGAALFAPYTFAFDLGGRNLYIYPNEDD